MKPESTYSAVSEELENNREMLKLSCDQSGDLSVFPSRVETGSLPPTGAITVMSTAHM